MRHQEIVTVFVESSAAKEVRTYPELDEWFDKGMYVESVSQSSANNTGIVCVTFVLRYYNSSTSRNTE